MKTTITGRNVDVSEAFRHNVEEGLKILSERYQIDPVDVTLILSKQNHLFHSDISSHIGRGVHMRAHGTGDDAYTSLAQVLSTLETRLRKYKRRLVSHHRHQDQHVTKETVPYFILNAAEPEIENSEDLAPAIIAEIPKEIPQLSVGDAVMRMDLGAEGTFIFRNSHSGRLNVVYRRADGNIGWVDPR